MKKSLLAVAVAAALPAFAYAQTNVTLSGNIKTGVAYTKYTDGAANNGSNTSLNDGSSRFIIAGTEDLGGGLKAIFQLDSRFRPDDGGDQNLAGGNSFVGLAGGFGTVRLGKLDTYYYLGLDEHGARATALQHSNTSLLGFIGDYAVAKNTRLSNVIRWDSPNFGGISGGLTFSPGASSGAGAGEGAAMGDGNKGQVWSANVGYAGGPLNVGVGYYDEKFEGYELATANYESIRAWRVFGGYDFGMFKVGLTYDEAKGEGAAIGGEFKRGVWSLPITAKLGAGTVLFTYSEALDGKANGTKDSDSGAKMFTIGYDYPLSKRTSVGVSYSEIKNDDNANYGYFTGVSLNNLSPVGLGQDQKSLHFGVRHAF